MTVQIYSQRTQAATDRLARLLETRDRVAALMFSHIDILDFWTQQALIAYWKELVLQCQEANYTGLTRDEQDTVETA